MIEITPMESPVKVGTAGRRVTLGLPSGLMQYSDRMFTITPEATALLVEKGFSVKVESGAGAAIHYPDYAYAGAGCEITNRDEALQADIVVFPGQLGQIDAGRLRHGCLLLTHYDSVCSDSEVVGLLLRRAVTTVALELIQDDNGHMPFADILSEIDGQAAVIVAVSLQADPVNGKGILPGGIGGVVPCEFTIIGSGISAVAAARSAVGLGASVRMFDDDLYGLGEASRLLGDRVVVSAMNRHVLQGALRSADVVIATPARTAVAFGSDMTGCMKRRAIVFDLNTADRRVFPLLPVVDLGRCEPVGGPSRLCYVNVGSRVPRSAAMAVSNAFLMMADEIMQCGSAGSIGSAMRMVPGLQPAVLTMFGKIVNQRLGRLVGIRPLDIAVFLSLS